MVNELVFTHNVKTNGISLRDFVDTDVEFIAAAVGATPLPDGYADEEAGYDGFELTGTYKGEVFKLYRRWNNTRVAGHDELDVVGFVADLKALLAGAR
jgi:hypothetical protein